MKRIIFQHLHAVSLLLVLWLVIAMNANAQIQLTFQTSYHRASCGSVYGIQEAGTADRGGLITLFVRNTGTATDSIAEIKISQAGTYATNWYAQSWPLEILPGQTASVWIKGVDTPFAEGDTILLEVISRSGYTDSQNFINRTPALRIANYMPEHDLSALYLYLRNDEANDLTLQTVTINDTSWVIGDPALTLYGRPVIKSGQVAMVKIQAGGLSWTPLMPLRMNVSYQSGSNTFQVSAFERLVPAEFPVGTWHSPIADDGEEEGRKRLRQLSINSVFGPGNLNNMNTNLPEYYMQVVREPDFSNNGVFDPVQGGQYVAQNNSNPIFYYWLVDDEPDLHTKPISEEIAKNMAYWNNDSNTPSYVNLASQKNYQRYGFYTDVVCMDHYSDDGPPCVIPFPYWYTTEGSVREALEYTIQLKKNTEPKRMNTWSQLISGAFSNQAEPHVVNFQFWSHVATGSKGMFFFTAKPSHPDDEPALWQESERLVQQLNGIKNLCLYSEPWDGITVNSGNAIAKALVGPRTLTLFLLNNSIDYTPVNVINRIWSSSVSNVPFDVQFTVPDWIPLDQFYETTATGKNGITSIQLISGRTYRITGTLGAASQVLVIGENDTQAPEQITEISISDQQSPSDFTLSWKEPLDDFGVKGYLIRADNDLVDTVRAPIWNSGNRFNACNIGYWSVIPFDDAGNLAAPAVVIADWSNFGAGIPQIYEQPIALSVNAGSVATFSVADSGAAYPVYTWQVDTGNGVWNDLSNQQHFSGVHTPTLSVYGLPSFNQSHFRCIIRAGCSAAYDTSASALLTVTGSLNVRDQESPGQPEIYPNPASDILHILAPEEHTLFEIYDVTGRRLWTDRCVGRTATLSLAPFDPGTYRIRLISSEGGFWQSGFLIVR